MPDEYREYVTINDQRIIAALDRDLTLQENTIVPTRTRYINRESKILPATNYFLALENPTIIGRSLFLIPVREQVFVPRGFGVYTTNAEIENWYLNPPII